MSTHNDARSALAEEAPRTVLAHPWRLVAVFVLTLLLLGRVVVQLADVQILDRQGYAKRASAEINQSSSCQRVAGLSKIVSATCWRLMSSVKAYMLFPSKCHLMNLLDWR